MNNNQIKKEATLLKCGYFAHLIIFALIIFIHVIGIIKMFWFSKSLYAFFKYLLILIVIIFLFPLIPLIFIFLKKLSLDLSQRMKIVSIAMILISLVVGIITCILIWTAVIDSKDFYENCPYHYTSSNIENYINQKKSIDCNKRICLYDKTIDSDILPYKYICSYNSMKEYKNKNIMYSRFNEKNLKIFSDTFIICDYLSEYKYKIKNEIVKTYVETCELESVFYLCDRFEKTTVINSINNSDNCPDNIYNTLIYLLGVFSIIFDVLISYVPLAIEYFLYKKLIYLFGLLDNGGINNNELVVINRTANTSENNNNNNQNNNENNSQINYIKEPTEIIIVEHDNCDDNKKNSKDFNINNSINNNKNNLNNSIKKNDEEDEEEEKIVFHNEENLNSEFGDKVNENNINIKKNNNDNNTLTVKQSSESKSVLLNRNPKKRLLRLVDFPIKLNHENCNNLEKDKIVNVKNNLKNNNIPINSLIKINSNKEKKINNNDINFNNLINSDFLKNSVENSQLITSEIINISIPKAKLHLSGNNPLKKDENESKKIENHNDRYATIANNINSDDIKNEEEQQIKLSINIFSGRNKKYIADDIKKDKNENFKGNELVMSSDNFVLKSKGEDSMKEDEKEE